MTPRVLFVGEDVTLAHVARPLALARTLDRDRVELAMATGPRYRHFVEGTGLPWYPLPTIDAGAFARRLALGRPLYRSEDLERYVAAELALFARWRPDVVVGDFRLSLGISAEVAGIPYVAIANAYWSPGSAQRLPVPEHPLVGLLGVRAAARGLRWLERAILAWHARAFNRVRRRYGLGPVGGLREVYTYAHRTLYADLPDLAPTRRIPATHRYLGPVLWEPPAALPAWWDRLPADRPLVYVTLGSSGRPELLAVVLDALRGMAVTAVVATAGHERGIAWPSGTFWAPFLPGLALARRAAVVVGNGGSLTNYQALAAGTPVLGLPANADQHLAFGPVVDAGAGLAVRAGQATPRRVRAALDRLLAEPGFRQAARVLATRIAATDAAGQFRAALEEVLAHRYRQTTQRGGGVPASPAWR